MDCYSKGRQIGEGREGRVVKKKKKKSYRWERNFRCALGAEAKKKEMLQEFQMSGWGEGAKRCCRIYGFPLVEL